MLPSLQRYCGLLTPGKPKWIYTFIWTLLVVIIGLGSVSCKTCTSRDLISLQTPCRSENDELVLHIGTNQTHKLCSALHKLWFCVAKNLPLCFHNMTFIYQHLTHSPHNCKLSDPEFLQIQNIIRENEVKEESSTAALTTTQQSSSTKKDNEDEDEGRYDVTGDNSEHTGNTGSSFRSSDHVTHLLLTLLTLIFPVVLPVL